MNTSTNNDNITIEDIFEECLDAVICGTASVETCIKKYPEQAAELAGLLDTALSISSSPDIEPSPGAKMRVRYALNEKLADITRPQNKPFWRFGWANAVATIVLSLSLAGGGLAFAAGGSMPGEALYPLKTSMEQTLVSLTPGNDAKITLYTAIIDRRVDEIMYLASIGDSLSIAEVTSSIAANFSAAAAIQGLDPNKSMDMLATPPGTESTVGITGAPTTSRATTESKAVSGILTEAEASQLANLADSPLGASPAVQLALEQAAAVIHEGYSNLLSQFE
ncbi:MAG: DUF5667 domain-containing protein [Dehalogenimonas sp.]